MNGLSALVICMVAGMFGGIGYGLYAYGGVVRPKSIERLIPLGNAADSPTTKMVMWVPGLFGHMGFGAITGVVIFGTFIAPASLVGWSTSVNLTWYNVASALVAGLSGSAAVGELIDRKQWSRLAPVLEEQQSDGTTPPPVVVQTPRAFQKLEQMGMPAN